MSATPTLATDAFSLCRDVTIPRNVPLTTQVEAVRSAYQRLTGRELPYCEAMRCLDRIFMDRREDGHDLYSPEPIPVEYSAVAAYLVSETYSDEAIRLFIRYAEQTGSAYGSGVLDGEDREAVQAILDRINLGQMATV